MYSEPNLPLKSYETRKGGRGNITPLSSLVLVASRCRRQKENAVIFRSQRKGVGEMELFYPSWR